MKMTCQVGCAAGGGVLCVVHYVNSHGWTTYLNVESYSDGTLIVTDPYWNEMDKNDPMYFRALAFLAKEGKLCTY